MAKKNPIKGPGKFEGESYLTKRAYEEGFFDEELGDSETFGWYGLILDWKTKGRGPFHGIISENSVGFVSGRWGTKKEIEGLWSQIEADYEEFSSEEEEEA